MEPISLDPPMEHPERDMRTCQLKPVPQVAIRTQDIPSESYLSNWATIDQALLIHEVVLGFIPRIPPMNFFSSRSMAIPLISEAALLLSLAMDSTQ